MKTAKQMKKIQEEATRTWMEHELTFCAKGKYNYFICSSEDCPDWLQEELAERGYTVTNINANGTRCNVRIEW